MAENNFVHLFVQFHPQVFHGKLGPFTEDDARSFLQEHDFIPLDSGAWLCEEVSLDVLDRTEILSVEPAE